MPLTPGYGKTPLPQDELTALLPEIVDILGTPVTRADVYDLEQGLQDQVFDELMPAALDGSLTLEDADLTGAPTIKQALDEAVAFIAGTVLVAHNCDFEEGFLAGAARRSGTKLPKMVGLCTLQSARRQLDGRAFNLTAMYRPRPGDGQISDTPHSATPAVYAKCCCGSCTAHP